MSEQQDHLRAEALFVSGLQRSAQPATDEVRRAVVRYLREYGGRGCAALVAAEFGEHPETAAPRMAWALETVRAAFAGARAAAHSGDPSGTGRPIRQRPAGQPIKGQTIKGQTIRESQNRPEP